VKGYTCKICGFISIDGKAPDKCPVCGAPKEAFKDDANAIMRPTSDTEKVETNKKHIPQISIKKECKLIPDGCVDVSIKIGEITHPMLPEHFIAYVDSYIDKKYISRIYFTPGNMNPAVGLHLKVTKGKFTAVAKCNIHGAWINEAEF